MTFDYFSRSIVAVDWRALHKGGQAYLDRLNLPDNLATYLAAKLYILEWNSFRQGLKFHPQRLWWEKPSTTAKRGPKRVGKTGRILFACDAEHPCVDCGQPCAVRAMRCDPCARHNRWRGYQKAPVSQEQRARYNANRKAKRRLANLQRKADNDSRDGCGSPKGA